MRRTLLFCMSILLGISLCAQQPDTHRRNSLALVLVYHPEDEFGQEIYKAFDSLPVPDTYDDHSVPAHRYIDNSTVRGVQKDILGFFKATHGHALSEKEIQANALYTEQRLNSSGMAKQLVANWFNLQGSTASEATFSTDRIRTEGQYKASDVDVPMALHTTRGQATLSDAGEELLSRTFVLVNDITYVTADRRATTAKTKGFLNGLLDKFTGTSSKRQTTPSQTGTADAFAGFKVKTHSYLYRLVWNDSIAAIFFGQHYTSTPDSAKILAFLNDRSTYKLKFVAHSYDFDEKNALKGNYSRTEQVRTACARSMDKNIVELAKQFEDFKGKTPVCQVLYDDKGHVQGYAAKIGLKEGISEISKFQVVQRVVDSRTHKTIYRYIATVKPVKGTIWDNRFNAVTEQAAGSELSYTTFKKIGGGEILPGMLLIDGKYSRVTE